MMSMLMNIRNKFKRDWEKNKSYRRKYTWYYALTFMLPVLVICVANIYSNQIIKKQTLQSNQKILTQFFNLVEEELGGIQKDAYSFVTDRDVWEYAEVLGQRTDIWNKKIELLDKLSVYCRDKGYEDVFVWYRDADRVISGLNPVTDFMDLEGYCESYYPGNDKVSAGIEKALKEEPLKSVLWSVKQEDGSQYFAVSVKRYPETSKLCQYEVAMIVDGAFFEQCIGDGVLVKGENALFFNKEGELLYSYIDSETTSLEEAYRATGVYEIKKNGKISTFLVQESACVEGYYAIEIPHDMFYRDLHNIQKISYLGIFISVVVGLFVAYRMSDNTYRPLEEVLVRFQEKIDYAYEPHKNSEFEFLTEALEQKEKEKVEAQLTHKEKDLDRRKKLLRIALEGRELSEAEIGFLETQVTFFPYFYGGVFRVKTCGKVGWEMMTFVVTNVFEEFFQEECSCDIIQVAFNQYVIVLNQDAEQCEERVNKLLKEGMDFLEQHLEVSVQFGMGNVCEGLYNLHTMYRQGQYALEYCFFKDKTAIIQYRDVQGRHIEIPHSEETPMTNMISEFMKHENATQDCARMFLQKVMERYGIHEESAVETVDYFKYEVIKALNHVWVKCDMEYLQRQSYIQKLNEADSLTVYMDCLATAVCETAQETGKNKNKNRLAEQIKQYVDENYTDADLSVSSIGDEFGMQAAYLSKIFREEYGSLILNYISTKRVNRAKELLKESRMNINEIAEATGFLSGNVFIKTFKKQEGVTPGKYRSAFISDKM